MTSITAAANLGWEVAGAKKNAKKLSPSDTKKVNGSAPKLNGKDTGVKLPRVENLAPLQLKGSIYDNLRESDDDDDEDVLNNNSKAKQDARVASLMHLDTKVSTSPKPASKKQAETVNLLQTSIAANKKKVSSPSAGRNVEVEFERALGQLKLEDFEKEHQNLSNIFPHSLLSQVQYLTNFLNQKLISIADIDPAANHENDIVNPTSKLDKKFVKYFNGLITKLNRNDSEALFDSCFEALFSDSSKSASNHGFKIVIQLLAKHSATLLSQTDLTKYANIISNNKHKPTRCLLALWALGQFGYYNLLTGVRIWFDCMLPFVAIKNCPNYVVSYLSAILQHHNIDSKSLDRLPAQLVTIDQYLRLYDFLNEKLVLSKDALQRLKSSFDIIRSWILHDLTHSGSRYFETLFTTLPLERSSKQSEYLYMLAQIVLTNDRDVLGIWRQIYARHLQQTLILLESLLEIKNIKNNRSLRETLQFFDQQTSAQLAKTKDQTKEGGNKPYYTRKSAGKTNDAELVRKLNELTRKLVNQQPKRTSPFRMAVRTLFFLILATGVFFYWDVNQNKSIYTNNVRKELDRYGLLKPLEKNFETVQKTLITARNSVYYYTPIYYKRASDAVGPALKSAYKYTREYSNLAWTKTEPLRESVVFYVNEAIDYVHANFPGLVKNLVSIGELVVNYLTTLGNFALYYTSQLLEFVGTQLLGMKRGELEKVFLDTFQFVYQYVNKQFLQAVNYLNKI